MRYGQAEIPWGPQVGPDRCLFAWPYHITTGYSFYPVQTNISLNNNSDGLKWQIIVYPCTHCNASQANSSISCLRVEGLSIYWIPKDSTQHTLVFNDTYIYIYVELFRGNMQQITLKPNKWLSIDGLHSPWWGPCSSLCIFHEIIMVVSLWRHSSSH